MASKLETLKETDSISKPLNLLYLVKDYRDYVECL